MTLTDILRERLSRKGNSAQVVCGELGVLTVEALPPAELTVLLRSAGGARAVLYAACRELQAAGEELRKAGELFQPDEIMVFLSEEETQAAVGTILELSGMEAPRQPLPENPEQTEAPPLPAAAADKAAESVAEAPEGVGFPFPAPSPGVFPDGLAAPATPDVFSEALAEAGDPVLSPTDLTAPAAAPITQEASPTAPAAPAQAPPKNRNPKTAHLLRQPAAPDSPEAAQPAMATATAKTPAVHPVISRPAREVFSAAAESVPKAAEDPAQLPEQEPVSAEALAEQVARRILTGLRNAAAVR